MRFETKNDNKESHRSTSLQRERRFAREDAECETGGAIFFKMKSTLGEAMHALILKTKALKRKKSPNKDEVARDCLDYDFNSIAKTTTNSNQSE